MTRRKQIVDPHGRWTPGQFLVAEWHGPVKSSGWIYRGLGLRLTNAGSPKGRRPPRWTLYHLGSGHGLGMLNCHVADAFYWAAQVAEAGDWNFVTLDGWKNQFPDVQEVFSAICLDSFGMLSKRIGRGPEPMVAQQIAAAQL